MRRHEPHLQLVSAAFLRLCPLHPRVRNEHADSLVARAEGAAGLAGASSVSQPLSRAATTFESVAAVNQTANEVQTMANIATISFHDQSIIAIEHEGAHFVAMRPIVENIGLDWQAQLQRIKRHPVLSKGVVVITTPSSGGNQETNCLPLSMLNGWLFGVDVNRVREEIRPKLIRYQTECFDVLYQHFMPKAPQPTPYTVQPGDTLNEAQQIALRALLESNVKRLPQEKQAAAMVGGWSKLKAHFGVPYRQIPASEFTEALSIIARHVSQWDVLDAPQQTQPAIDPLNAQAMAAASKQANEYFDAARQGQFTQPTAIPPEVLCGLLAQAMLNQRFILSFDRHTGRMNLNPVPDDAYVLSWPQFARAVVTNDIDPTNTELADLASACNRRLAQRLAV